MPQRTTEDYYYRSELTTHGTNRKKERENNVKKTEREKNVTLKVNRVPPPPVQSELTKRAVCLFQPDSFRHIDFLLLIAIISREYPG